MAGGVALGVRGAGGAGGGGGRGLWSSLEFADCVLNVRRGESFFEPVEGLDNDGGGGELDVVGVRIEERICPGMEEAREVAAGVDAGGSEAGNDVAERDREPLS